jgi:hypothetical protein
MRLGARSKLSSSVVLGLVGSLTAVVTGCPAFLSWDLPQTTAADATSGLGDASDALADAGASDAGPCRGVCVTQIPSGVAGPYLVVPIEAGLNAPATPGACADGEAGTVLYGELDAAPALCAACSCNALGTCNPPTLTVYAGSGDACDAGVLQSVPIFNGCTPIPFLGSNPLSVLSSMSGEGCGSTGGNLQSLPPAEIGSAYAACSPGPTIAGACAAGVCVESPPGASLCIVSDGGAPCPPGFPNARVYSTSQNLSDNRTCVGCGCTIVPDSCTGQVLLFSNPSCSPAPLVTESFPANCLAPLAQAPQSANIASMAQQPSCQPEGGTPTGSVSFVYPTIYCCR